MPKCVDCKDARQGIGPCHLTKEEEANEEWDCEYFENWEDWKRNWNPPLNGPLETNHEINRIDA